MAPDLVNIETRYGCNQSYVEQFDDLLWQIPVTAGYIPWHASHEENAGQVWIV